MKKTFVTKELLVGAVSLLGIFYLGYFKSIYAELFKTHMLGFILFSISTLALTIFIIYCFWAYFRQKKIIDDLIQKGEYKEAIVTCVKEDKKIDDRYVYICIDKKTKHSYKSEIFTDIEKSNVSIGDIVRVYQSEKYPKIYWVDTSQIGKTKIGKDFTEEEKDKGERSRKKLIHEATFGRRNKFYGIFVLCTFITMMYLPSLIANIHLYFRGTEVHGIVRKITTQNDICKFGRGSWKHTYECTQFSADVELYDISLKLDIYDSAVKNLATFSPTLAQDLSEEFKNSHPTYILGNYLKIRGHNAPITLSQYSIGQKLTLLTKKDVSTEIVLSSWGNPGLFSEMAIKDEVWEKIVSDSLFILIFLILPGLSCLYIHFRKYKTFRYVS